jgi:hypothetical protein
MTKDEYDRRYLDADSLENPSAWIQWKGTDVCMDVRCDCGAVSHVDADFAYYYRCPSCREVFRVGQSIRLYPMSPDERAAIGDMGSCLVEGHV